MGATHGFTEGRHAGEVPCLEDMPMYDQWNADGALVEILRHPEAAFVAINNPLK